MLLFLLPPRQWPRRNTKSGRGKAVPRRTGRQHLRYENWWRFLFSSGRKTPNGTRSSWTSGQTAWMSTRAELLCRSLPGIRRKMNSFPKWNPLFCLHHHTKDQVTSRLCNQDAVMPYAIDFHLQNMPPTLICTNFRAAPMGALCPQTTTRSKVFTLRS